MSETEQIYPKPQRRKRDRPDLRWRARYEHMAYDNGTQSWDGYHRTYLGARIAAWWHQNITSWGGVVTLTDRGEVEQ